MSPCVVLSEWVPMEHGLQLRDVLFNSSCDMCVLCRQPPDVLLTGRMKSSRRMSQRGALFPRLLSRRVPTTLSGLFCWGSLFLLSSAHLSSKLSGQPQAEEWLNCRM